MQGTAFIKVMSSELMIETKRCQNFWNGGECDRPLISFWIGTFSVPDIYPHSMNALPDGVLNPDEISFSIFQKDYLNQFKNNQYLQSDSPWSAFPIMTIPWLEAILGCPIQKKGNNIWADPVSGTLNDLLSNPVRLNENKWLDLLLNFTSWLVDYSDGRFPVSVSLLRGPSDLLSALRGPSQMCLDLYDYPDLVLKVLDQITKVWIKTAHEQLSIIPPYMNGYCFGQIYLWSPDKCSWFQDDALALLSPNHFQYFLLPFEKQIAASLPFSGIHLHPLSLHVIDDLIAIPELNVIEINYETHGPSIHDMLPYFRKVIHKKRLVVWGDFSDNDLILIKENLPAENLCLQIITPSAESARKKMSLVKKIWNN
jgi:hypothetical protein